ncbi:MAG TPA: YtxH domain-containing protein [Verrucomicrobiae bacterium]|nr:YtxH domain-containing protein [Verrucomicrobiae bacterium]
MKKLIWIVIGIAIGAAAMYFYDKNKPTETEKAVTEVQHEAEQTQGRVSKFVDNAANKLDKAMNKELN